MHQLSVWAWSGWLKGPAHLFCSSVGQSNWKVTATSGNFNHQDQRFPTWGSGHPGGANFVLRDGSVRFIRFHPDASNGTKGPSSQAETDAEARFQLKYSRPNEGKEQTGAVVGNHKVLVFDLKAATDPNSERLRFAPSYTQIATTPLAKEVKRGKQTIEIDLTTK